jgi:hypothetical protein
MFSMASSSLPSKAKVVTANAIVLANGPMPTQKTKIAVSSARWNAAR